MKRKMRKIWSIINLAFLGIIALPLISSLELNADSIPILCPAPTSQQLEWQKMELAFFVHFTINTFTDKEWGDGTEDPRLFNPTQFDARQWVKTVKDSGGKLLILTCKHHDGFCLWPSQYTDHSVKQSPWKDGKGDVVREVSDACREYGIQFGVYLSPWDRHEPCYGDSPAYNRFFVNQLTELLTQYGEIAEVWFDGANGEGPNGKRQEYDWNAYYRVIRDLQPNAVIAIMGPDIRWVGNEAGVARETEWSVQIVSSESLDDPRIKFNPSLCKGSPDLITVGAEKVNDVAFGHLRNDFKDLTEEAHLIWYPAETDVSIRPGWFYHASQDHLVKSLDHLVKIYFESIGRNSFLLLNVPPDSRGLFHENDVQRLREWREYLNRVFETDLALRKKASADHVRSSQFAARNLIDGNPSTYWAADEDATKAEIEIDFLQPTTFDMILLQEPIELGQRIGQYSIDCWNESGWSELAAGTTIGYKKIDRFPETTASKIRVQIHQARACPVLSTVSVYNAP